MEQQKMERGLIDGKNRSAGNTGNNLNSLAFQEMNDEFCARKTRTLGCYARTCHAPVLLFWAFASGRSLKRKTPPGLRRRGFGIVC